MRCPLCSRRGHEWTRRLPRLVDERHDHRLVRVVVIAMTLGAGTVAVGDRQAEAIEREILGEAFSGTSRTS